MNVQLVVEVPKGKQILPSWKLSHVIKTVEPKSRTRNVSKDRFHQTSPLGCHCDPLDRGEGLGNWKTRYFVMNITVVTQMKDKQRVCRF